MKDLTSDLEAVTKSLIDESREKSLEERTKFVESMGDQIEDAQAIFFAKRNSWPNDDDVCTKEIELYRRQIDKLQDAVRYFEFPIDHFMSSEEMLESAAVGIFERREWQLLLIMELENSVDPVVLADMFGKTPMSQGLFNFFEEFSKELDFQKASEIVLDRIFKGFCVRSKPLEAHRDVGLVFY